MPSSTRSSRNNARVPPPATVHMLNADGIDFHLLQSILTRFLGPNASIQSSKLWQDGRQFYVYYANRPFIPSEVRDLRAFSAELSEGSCEPIPSSLDHHRTGSGGSQDRRVWRSRESPSPIIQIVQHNHIQNAYINMSNQRVPSPDYSARLDVPKRYQSPIPRPHSIPPPHHWQQQQHQAPQQQQQQQPQLRPQQQQQQQDHLRQHQRGQQWGPMVQQPVPYTPAMTPSPEVSCHAKPALRTSIIQQRSTRSSSVVSSVSALTSVGTV